jgi:hypothetical protein
LLLTLVRTQEAGETYLEGMIVEVKDSQRALPTVAATAPGALVAS